MPPIFEKKNNLRCVFSHFIFSSSSCFFILLQNVMNILHFYIIISYFLYSYILFSIAGNWVWIHYCSTLFFILFKLVSIFFFIGLLFPSLQIVPSSETNSKKKYFCIRYPTTTHSQKKDFSLLFFMTKRKPFYTSLFAQWGKIFFLNVVLNLNFVHMWFHFLRFIGTYVSLHKFFFRLTVFEKNSWNRTRIKKNKATSGKILLQCVLFCKKYWPNNPEIYVYLLIYTPSVQYSLSIHLRF